jgi:hypothetical protein
MILFIPWLQQHLLTCSFREHFGIDCPGCGFQRALLELFKGNISMSIHSFPAALPWIATIGLTGVHLLFPMKDGAALVKYSFLITAGIMIFSYILKLTST